MYRFAARAFLVLSVLAAALGCGVAPIYNVTNQAIVTAGAKPKTLEEIRAAIVEGGKARGWTMTEIGPGHLEAKLHVRVHVAVVDIKYSTTSYSITYKDSKDLKYDGTDIHRNYNSWVQNLQSEIEKRLK